MAGWNEWIPGKNMTLTEVLDALESAIVGLDIKDKLYWSFYKVVELAIKEGNANFDVAKAAGTFKDLASRLDAGEQVALNALNEANRKIDNASGTVTMDNLTQEVKTAMTGGSVAVVGEGAVGMVNLNAELSTIINDWTAVLTNENESWVV